MRNIIQDGCEKASDLADETMRECAELGIKHVWMHRGPGAGSVSAAATGYGRAHGITVIDGGCPCMFGPTADRGHKVSAFAARYGRGEPQVVWTTLVADLSRRNELNTC